MNFFVRSIKRPAKVLNYLINLGSTFTNFVSISVLASVVGIHVAVTSLAIF